MPELREDLTTKDWVVLATERARRPHDFRRVEPRAAAVDYAADCPFCPGNESQTPGEIERLRLAGSNQWSLRVVPNRFPAFVRDGDPHRAVHADHFRSMHATGAHEVIIETPHHGRALPDLSDAEIALVFEGYQRRYGALRSLPGMEVVIIFKNYGEAAGTSLMHPHSQIIAAPVATPAVRRKYEVARDHYEEWGTCLYCDVRDWERAAGDRVIFETSHFIAIHPYASRWPFETWILPLQHTPSFGSATPDQLAEAALATRRILRLLRAALGDPPFNYVVHTAPVGDEERPYFLWHIQIVPRLTVAAGFEMGSGMYINTALPEQTAAFLRDADRGGGDPHSVPASSLRR